MVPDLFGLGVGNLARKLLGPGDRLREWRGWQHVSPAQIAQVVLLGQFARDIQEFVLFLPPRLRSLAVLPLRPIEALPIRLAVFRPCDL
jgi:hypothetical protein